MQLPEITLFTLTIVTVLVVALTINHQRIKKAKQAQYRQGLHWLKQLSVLLSLIQQHRGLTMAHINGDTSLAGQVSSIKQKVNSQIQRISQTQGTIADNYIWQGITDHWQRLANNYTSYESLYNFNQHCNMVTNILHLIEESAEEHHLQELQHQPDQYANMLWEKLLYSIEHIGQARAVGTAIAAAQSSTSVERIKLNYLKSCVEKSLLAEKQDFDLTIVKDLISTINKQLLIDKPTINAQDYFGLASQGMQTLLKQFDLYVNNLERLLAKQ